MEDDRDPNQPGTSSASGMKMTEADDSTGTLQLPKNIPGLVTKSSIIVNARQVFHSKYVINNTREQQDTN
jgi:hypothetical protein